MSKYFVSSLRRLHQATFDTVRISKRLRVMSTSSAGITSSPAPVICNDEHGIRRITLNNPKRRNVLSFEALSSIRKFIGDVDEREHDVPVGCVVIDSVGDHVFSSGHDLREVLPNGARSAQQLFDLCADLMLRIGSLSVPVVAQVRGLAAAAGCQLVASCDIVVASERASFSTPGINVGLFCSTPGVALVRALPSKVASYMLHTGLPITAKEAAVHGLVSLVVADDLLEHETMKIASVICEKSMAVQAIGKRCVRRQHTMTVEQAYLEASRVMIDNLELKDARSGIEAFIAKRPTPKWSNS